MDSKTKYILHKGEAFEYLRSLPDNSVDGVITDPPYSSGARTLKDKAKPPSKRYCHGGNALGRPEFIGDNKDQRSWITWSALWMSECYRILKPGGYMLSFIDWRMLPAATDAIQMANFIWRGVIVWDKGRGSRAPHKGYFRHQCEYVVWGTKGELPVPELTDPRGGPFDGCYQEKVLQSDKHHMTGKPTELLRKIVQCVPPGGVVVDPFMGSGTTGVAALLEGRKFIGVEYVNEYYLIATERIKEVTGI